MGSWGVGIFDDDLALDINQEYEEIFVAEQSHETTTSILIDRYDDSLEDEDESAVFWLAIAEVQISHRALSERVKVNSLEIIDSGRDLIRWKGSPDLSKRKEVLEQLKTRLLKS
jgi:hypothetical protein